MDEREVIEQASALAGLSVLAANVRVIILQKHNLVETTRACILAFFAGLITGLFIKDWGIDVYWKFGIIGLAGVIAEDLIRAVIVSGKKIAEKPIEVLIKTIFRE